MPLDNVDTGTIHQDGSNATMTGARPMPNQNAFVAGATTNAPFPQNSSNGNGGPILVQEYQAKASDLEVDFLSQLRSHPILQTDIFKTLDHYLDAAVSLEQCYWDKAGGSGAPAFTTEAAIGTSSNSNAAIASSEPITCSPASPGHEEETPREKINAFRR